MKFIHKIVYSALNVIGLYHDSILARAIASLPGKKPTPSAHNRYTKFWSANNWTYRRLSIAVVLIQYTEVLWETLARKKFGEKGRWRLILSLEAIKVAFRLILLQSTKSRPLVYPHTPEREIDPAQFESLTDTIDGDLSLHGAPNSTAITVTSSESGQLLNETNNVPGHSHRMLDLGEERPDFRTKEAVSEYLLKKVLYVDDIKPPQYLLHKVRGVGKLAEILYILRPLIYAYALKTTRDKKNWRPWLIGIALEYASRELGKQDFAYSVPGGLRALTKLEKEERNRRAWGMGWWLLRGAFYENITKPRLEKIAGNFEASRIGLSIFGNLIKDYQYLWENYFSTANM